LRQHPPQLKNYPIFAKTLSMEFEPKLRNFFPLVVLLVLGIAGWVAYAGRSNAASNYNITQVAQNGDEERHHSFFNSDNNPFNPLGDSSKLDMSSPFYKSRASNQLDSNKVRGTKGRTTDPIQKDGVIICNISGRDTITTTSAPDQAEIETTH
jgi:hypothetical protein